jgi:UDP-glucose 4-epimerase
LLNDGHQAVVYDSLCKGHQGAIDPRATFVNVGLQDDEGLWDALTDNRIEAVIHLAATSLVGESVEDPAQYYDNNLISSLRLLDAMSDCGVSKIVFSSTAAVYGEPEKQPITETDPTNPTNPYAKQSSLLSVPSVGMNVRMDYAMPAFAISMLRAQPNAAASGMIPRRI